jgi:hypothetical protein
MISVKDEYLFFFFKTKTGKYCLRLLNKRDLVGYWIESSPEREMSQSQRGMYEPMVESGGQHEVHLLRFFRLPSLAKLQ